MIALHGRGMLPGRPKKTDNPAKCGKCGEERGEKKWGPGPRGTDYEKVTVCGLCAWQIEADKRNAEGFEEKLPPPPRPAYRW